MRIPYLGGVTERTLVPFLEGGAFFECPRWRDGRWWVSDFYREAVYTVSADGREELVLEVEHQPSGLGWLPDGSLLIVSMKDQRVLRLDPDGNVSIHADLGAFTDSSLNDMVVDGRGRAWVGCFGFDLMGFADPQLAPLMRIDPDGTATIAAEELMRSLARYRKCCPRWPSARTGARSTRRGTSGRPMKPTGPVDGDRRRAARRPALAH